MSAPGGPQVKPGESRAIMVDVTTDTWEGGLKRVILVETNDPQSPVLNLTVTAHIYTLLQVEPKFIDFGDTRPGSVQQREILVRNRWQKPVTLTQLTVDPVGMASLNPPRVPPLKPETSTKLILTLSPGAYSGPIYGNVTFETDWKNLPRKTIRFRAHVIANDR